MIETSVKRLNLGCGVDSRAGWVNLDSSPLPGVDVVHDIENLPLPFEAGTFDEILCQDVLEHVEYIPVLRDLHRILKPGGRLVIRVPHFTSRNNFVDPTHRKLFSIDTWEFFVSGDTAPSGHMDHLAQVRRYYFDFGFRASEGRRITFEKRRLAFFFNPMVSRFVNRSRQSQSFYESCFLSRLFPAENILVTLLK